MKKRKQPDLSSSELAEQEKESLTHHYAQMITIIDRNQEKACISDKYVQVPYHNQPWATNIGFVLNGFINLFAEEAVFLFEKGIIQLTNINELYTLMPKRDSKFTIMHCRVYLWLKQRGMIVQRSDKGFSVWTNEAEFKKGINAVNVIYTSIISTQILDECKSSGVVLCCVEGSDIEFVTIK